MNNSNHNRRPMTRQEIQAAIPHRDPFLLVDRIIERGAGRIVGEKTFSGGEWFFAGHYPDYPVVPGVLLCEAAMQCGAILLGEGAEERGEGREERGEGREKGPHPSPLPKGEGTEFKGPHPNPLPKGEGTEFKGPHPSPLPKGEGTEQRLPVVTRIGDVRFKRMVRPGETLLMEVELVERLSEAYFFKAKVSVDGRIAVRFEFACALAARQ